MAVLQYSIPIQQLIGLFLLLSASRYPSSEAAQNQLLIPANVTCACPNEVLSFYCTIVGGGATVWGGSAVPCADIILRHSAFSTASGTCSNGSLMITARSGRFDDNCFTSHLDVIVISGLNNQTITCSISSSLGVHIIGETTITVITAPIPQIPMDVKLTRVETGQLAFNWTPVNSNCPSIYYMTTLNCGTCSVAIGTTTATCSGLQLPNVCSFTVQTVVCGQVGAPSDPVTVTLRVPDKPILNIIPVYSADTQNLLRLKAIIVNRQAPFYITDTVSVSVTAYNISYNSATTMLVDRNMSCVTNVCEYSIPAPSDVCTSLSDISVTLSAYNELGQGHPSNSISIGCTNQLVDVEYNRMTSAIICRFLYELDTSIKSCVVMYGQCDQELNQITRGNSTVENPNIISLRVNSSRLDCYVVIASSGSFTVIVDSQTNDEDKGTDSLVAAIVVPIVVVLLIAIVVIFVILLLVSMRRRKTSQDHSTRQSEILFNVSNPVQEYTEIDVTAVSQTNNDAASKIDVTSYDNIENQPFESVEVTTRKKADVQSNSVIDIATLPSTAITLQSNRFNKYTVSRDCELREYIEVDLGLTFQRGCAFYEFQHDVKNIIESEDKELLSQDEISGGNLYYSHCVDKEKLQEVGYKELWYNPNPPMSDSESACITKVFIQSVGSGARYIPAGSTLLYESQLSASNRAYSSLKQVLSIHFIVTTIQSLMTIKQFCEDNEVHICERKSVHIFLELGSFEKKSNLIDVILQDRKTGLLYTGPVARHLVKDYYNHREGPDLIKWRVFALCKFEENMVLQPDTKILHQNPKCAQIASKNIHVLTVDDDRVRMSDFIKKKLGVEFTNGHAFYEFKRPEDLDYYKEVILLPVDSQQELVMLKLSVDLFYGIPGVPDKDVKPPKVEGDRIFIQNTSHGARCLKRGETILYKGVTVPKSKRK